MKKSISLLLLLAGLVVIVAAQSLRKSEKIQSEQVPVAIRNAFESDFGNIPEGGYWVANFIVEKEGARSVAKPLSYVYHNKQQKTEVRYTADGKLDFVKGLEKNKHNNAPAR